MLIQADIQVSEVLKQLLSICPDIQPMLERCACAIGEDIISREKVLTQDSTLVLLSPVAGG
ncbi:MAG: MoaD/ThiS family protein [Acinetobacter sp.]